MALVEYPSSDEEDKEDKSDTVKDVSTFKRKRYEASELPPLPSKFHDLYASTTRVSTRDDPSLHQGRKRVMPHVEGNWPTHVYIEWYPSKTEDGSLTKLVSALHVEISPDTDPKVYSLVINDIGVPLPLHVSLSRSLGFVTQQKDNFVDSLDRALKVSGIRPFGISFLGLKWVANFERTRWFLVLTIARPELDGLNKLLYICNSTVKQYGQPPLYPKTPIEPAIITQKKQEKFQSPKNSRNQYNTSPSKTDWTEMQDATDAFHISLAWTLEKPSQELLELTEAVAKDHLNELKRMEVKVEEIKCKVGNIVTNMPLPSSLSERQLGHASLFGT